MTQFRTAPLLGLLSLLVAAIPGASQTATLPGRAQTIEALRRAAAFYRSQVSTAGGYHFRYAADLSYGRSEHAEGPTQITVQRAGTPTVALAYLAAFDATGDRFYIDAAREAARALVRGQLCSGGWDYIVEFDAAKRAEYGYRADGCKETRGRNPTTLDDNVTQAALRVLMRVDRALEFGDGEIHSAVEYALDHLLAAQYANGAWPQRFFEPPAAGSQTLRRASYPETWPRTWRGDDYRGHYTLNDNSQADMIDALLEAARIYGESRDLEAPRYLEAARRGGEFLLLAQMPDPQPAWAQQYNEQMQPAWARLFEPPSVTGGESQSVLRILLALYRETADAKYIEPLPRALEYLRRSVLPEDPDPPLRKKRTCPPGAPCLARFYELRTNRPLYITMGTQVRVPGQAILRPDGYELSYDDSSTIAHYAMWVNGAWIGEIAGELAGLRGAGPAEIRRPDRLSGLSPWQDRQRDPMPRERLAGRAADVIAALNERGAWTEPGTIGKADSVVSVFAAEDMAVTVGGRSFTLKEGETIEVFRGAKPPLEQVIASSTFASNVETLAEYLKALQ
jgi:PelA/Pel-15E family pectate lyase